MRRLTIGSFLVAVVGALALLGLVLVSGGNSEKTYAAFGVADATPGSVQNLAIDTNTAGNTATAVGTVQACRVVAGGIGTTFDIDVVIDEIAAADGTSGIGADIVYNPAILKVNARAAGSAHLFFSLAGGSYFDALSDSLPDTDGDYRHDAADIGGPAENGEGVMIRVTMEVVGLGVSALDLTDNIEFDGTPNPLDGAGSPLPVVNVIDGEIHTDGSPCPVAADLAVTAVTTTSPASFAAGSPFVVSVSTDVTSDVGPISADLSVLLAMPADCSPSGPNPQVTSTSYNAGLNNTVTNFTVTCTNPSFHNFTATSSVTETDGTYFETVTGNNSMGSNTATTAITATADIGLNASTVTTTLPTNCLPASPPAPGCTPLPRLVVGANGTVTVNKDIFCASGCPVQVTDTITFVGAVWNGDGGPVNPANCTAVTSPQSVTQSTSAADPSFSFTISCPAAIGGGGDTGDANAERASVCFNGLDDDGDGTVDDGCSSFVSDPILPGPQISPIIFNFSNALSSADVHVTDTSAGNDSQLISVPVWVTKPFNPRFLATISSTDTPSAINLPTTDNCLTNGAVFPAGLACEMAFESRIASPATPAPDDAMPLALAVTSIPRPAFSIAAGNALPPVGPLGEPAQPGVANGTIVGNFGFLVNIALSAHSCDANVNVPYGAVSLRDGALPTNSAGFDDDNDGAIDEDPADGVDTGGADTDVEVDEDGMGPVYIGFPGPGEGPNNNIIDTPGATPNEMDNPAYWPTRLNSDDILKSISIYGANGIPYSGDEAPVWARYSGFAPGVNSAVNVIVFNAGTSYLQETIVGDPNAPSSPLSPYQCTQFDSTTDYLGELSPGGQVLRQCNVVQNNIIIGASYTRADTFESFPTGDTVNCSPSNTSVTLTKDETIGDNNPLGDIVDAGIDDLNTVTVTIVGSGNLTLSLVGPAVCNPHWVSPVLDSFPSVIAGTQTSVITIPAASGVINAQYSVNCPVGGPYDLQVVANLTPGGGEDTSDNQDENHIAVVVTCDSDGDGICTPTDNCPNVPNADQTDTDGDGIGDACDTDDDGDGNPDATDDCDLLAEDADGIDDADGCPDTDVGISVEKEEVYTVDVSVSTAKNVEITVTNGNYPANVRVVITAVSHVGECEVRLVPHPGDSYSEYYTDEVAGPPNPDTLTSQIEFVIPMAAGQSTVLNYTYNIHCMQPSAHPGSFQLQFDALPLAPVQEENLGNPAECPSPWCTPATPANPSASDNVHKNYPDVTAFNRADLQKIGCTVNAPATAAGGANFLVTSTCTIKNNGPHTGDYSDSTTLVLPSDCTTVSANPQVSTGTLASGAQTNIAGSWTVQCTNPSNHTFSVNNVLSLTGPLHTYDPVPGNNTGSGSDTMSITVVTDVVVSGVTVTSPASANAGASFVVTVSGNVALGFASGGTTTIGLTGPGDCTLTPVSGQSQPSANGIQSATWNVVCTNSSNHAFNGSVSVSPTFPQHVSETDTANNTASGGPSTTAIIKLGDPSCTLVVAPDGTVTSTGAPGTNVIVTNNCNSGGLTTTILETTAGSCTITGGPGTYNVQIPAGTNCTYSVTVCINAGALHETDTDLGNNCATDTGLICLDQDGDGVDDGGPPCDGPDNCPTTPNADQADSDGDGIGDACDSTPTHDVLVKYIILVGPAAVNLSDTNGRYMWVIAEVGNNSSHTELVTVSISIAEAVPAGCTRSIVMILPGQTQFIMVAGEQKFIVWRVRYECHSTTAQVLTQTVTVSIAHNDIDGAGPHNGNDSVPANNTKTTSKQVIIQ